MCDHLTNANLPPILVLQMPETYSNREEYDLLMSMFTTIRVESKPESSEPAKTTTSSSKTKNSRKKRKIQKLKETMLCIVCKEKNQFTPCNHVCCCENCNQKILNKCIYCNAAIQNKTKIYFP
jgi:hypothetical protein